MAAVTIVVTGATGALGERVVDALLRRGEDPGVIVAAGRRPDALARLARRGLRTAGIDFDDPPSVVDAFAGATAVLVVSAPGNPGRQAQHRHAIDAAASSGAGRVVYTSWANAAVSSMQVAIDHRATEVALRAAIPSSTVLRFAGYFEARSGLAPVWRRLGVVLGAAGGALVSSATRDDLAEAAAVVLTSDGHDGATYELASDVPYTLEAYAEVLGQYLGEHLPYRDLAVDALEAAFVEAGFAPRLAAGLADYDRATAAGECLVRTGDLRRLVGRSPTELADAVARDVAKETGA